MEQISELCHLQDYAETETWGATSNRNEGVVAAA